MSSVYCGYCGTRGHNRLGCPDRKKIARESPDSYIAHQVASEKRRRELTVMGRSCSYCRQKGHNRRGCAVKKADMIKINQCQTRYLSSFSSHCAKIGLLPGSLVAVSCDERKTVMYIESLNWPSITFLLRDIALDGHGRLHWKINSTRIFTTMVVSDQVYPGEWAPDPALPGHRGDLQMEHLSPLFGDIFQQPRQTHREPKSVEILSPIFEGDLNLPEDEININRDLAEHFCLLPASKFTHHHDGSRLGIQNSAWKEIYPSEHLQAWKEGLDRS